MRRRFRDSLFWQQDERYRQTIRNRLHACCLYACGEVWRVRGTERTWRNNHIFVQEISHYGLSGLIVLNGVSIGRRTQLLTIRNDNLTTQRYANDILRPHVVSYAATIDDSFFYGRSQPSFSVLDVETALFEEWNSIPQSHTNNLITSMLNLEASIGSEKAFKWVVYAPWATD
ncbi:hypothetical protein TNCV_1345991 [Trichonephila clavipes]|nr:hypothetical protein TNCV_1345991 [Trichonephila clavipes]